MNREEQILDWIRNGIQQFAGGLVGYQIVLFGSRAGRNHRPRSDFDIGVCGNTPLPFQTFAKISDFLEALPTLYRIDWVDLNRVAPAVKTEALKNAVVLYGQ